MAIPFFSGKKGKKRIVLFAVAAVLCAALIAANVVLYTYQSILHAYFGGLGSGGGTVESENALNSADDLIGEIAEESFVLLKNDDGFLPLEKGSKVNFFGWGSSDNGFLLVGGGSGGSPIEESNPMHLTLLEAFEEYRKIYEYDEPLYNTALAAKYDEFTTTLGDVKDADYRGADGSTGANAEDSLKNPGADWYGTDLMNEAKSFSNTAVVVLSRWGCENGGGGELVETKMSVYRDGTFLELTAEEKAIFEKLEQGGFDVVVLLNTTNPLELGFLETYKNIRACLYIGIPGQSGARAVPWVLYGEKPVEILDENGEGTGDYEFVEVSPSGRLSDTYAYDWQTENPVYANALSHGAQHGYPGNAGIVYQEGIYFGYKWYETADADGYFSSVGKTYEDVVQFPFGYGLSYTTFSHEITEVGYYQVNEKGEKEKVPTDGLDLLEPDTEYYVTVHVANTGDRRGAEVVQLYYSAPYYSGQIEKASINLLAFGKTAQLEKAGSVNGEGVSLDQQDVVLSFTAYDMASYDADDKNQNNHMGYELDEGDYEIKLMANAHEALDDCEPLLPYCDGIKFDSDPATGAKVENRFTTNSETTAYANMPVDGSTGIAGGVSYLSRENKFENFPRTVETYNLTQSALSAAGYTYEGDAGADTAGIDFGNDAGSYLTVVASDGSRPNNDDLTGAANARKLEVNEELFEELCDWDNEDAWNEFLNQMTRTDVANLIIKGGFRTMNIESIGKPFQMNTDGPAGFNSAVISPGNPDPSWAVFPAETLTGCCWNTRLTYNLGRAQGMIGNATNAYGWYAPGVNLHRSVYNTRNYEYYSEDPVLSGELGAETVRGAKQLNLYCYVKHFVLSDNGENAKDWYEWIPEQALREVYLKPFEICVKEGGANAMMSAFNKLGAVWCGYNHALLTDVLRGEWGFHGSVITDWHMNDDYMKYFDKGVKAGNDLWLFGSNPTGDQSLAIDSDNALKYASRQSVKGILYTYVDTYMAAKDYQKNGDDSYNVALGAGVSKTPFSPVVPALWAVADVVLILGIGACVLFMFFPKAKKEE